MPEEDLLRLINLLGKYGEAKFGDEWWPGNAQPILGEDEGSELEQLLEALPTGPYVFYYDGKPEADGAYFVIDADGTEAPGWYVREGKTLIAGPFDTRAEAQAEMPK